MIDKKTLFLIKNDLETALKTECPVHDAGLRHSIKVTPKENGVIITMLGYGQHVEFGTAPHAIPVSKDNPDSEQLRKWVKDKWGDENLIYVLANHIKRYGTRPHPFVRTVFKRELPKILKRYLS